MCWPAASSGSPASDLTFDLGETVASPTPTPRLLIALHPSLDWIQENCARLLPLNNELAQLDRLVPCSFPDDRTSKSYLALCNS